VVGVWKIPFNKSKLPPVWIPVVLAPPTFTMCVAPTPVNPSDISSNILLFV
jgi:hypothetical protein